MTDEKPKITKSLIAYGSAKEMVKLLEDLVIRYGGATPVEVIIKQFGKGDLVLC